MIVDPEGYAQIARMNDTWRAKVAEALQDKELRKWCMEKALDCDNLTIPTSDAAAEIYKFITAPLADLLQEK